MIHTELAVDAPCYSFFCYGTLRPDDNSGAPWNQRFLSSSISWAPAILRCARLLLDSYGVLTMTGSETDIVHGAVVTFPSDNFAEKLAEADDIEECPALYQRQVVRAELKETPSRTTCAWVYFRSFDNPQALPACAWLPSGDWLDRYQLAVGFPFPLGPSPIFYFAYGRNMSAAVMARRGIKFNRAYRFTAWTDHDWTLRTNKPSTRFPKEMGFANIERRGPSLSEDSQNDGRVFGIAYALPASEVEKLDKLEEVPTGYTRNNIAVALFIPASASCLHAFVNVSTAPAASPCPLSLHGSTATSASPSLPTITGPTTSDALEFLSTQLPDDWEAIRTTFTAARLVTPSAGTRGFIVRTQAWVYLATAPSKEDLPVAPSYVADLAEGADLLPASYTEKLLTLPITRVGEAPASDSTAPPRPVPIC